MDSFLRHFRSFVLLALVFLFISATPNARAEDRSVKIGVITALTGPLATIGTAVKNGIELARSERPELFKNIDFIYEDDQFDPKQSLTAYKKLRSIDRASIIFGFGDTLGIILGPLADKDGVLLVNFNFEASPAIGKKFVVRSMNHTLQYMNALASHLLKQGNLKFTIIQTESPFFNAMVNSFRQAVGTSATVDILATYNPTDTDFKASILKLKKANKTPLGIFLSPDQILEFLKQAKELDLDRQYFGTDLFETAASINPDPTNLQGCLYPDNQVSAQFRTDYRSKYGNEAQMTFAGSGYEMALLVGELISAGNAVDPTSLINSFSAIKQRAGVLGQYSFVNDPHYGKFFEFPVYLKQIVGSVGVPVH